MYNNCVHQIKNLITNYFFIFLGAGISREEVKNNSKKRNFRNFLFRISFQVCLSLTLRMQFIESPCATAREASRYFQVPIHVQTLFIYHQVSLNSFACSQRNSLFGCGGRVMKNSITGVISQTHPHNHEPPADAREELVIINEIVRLCEDVNKTLSQIILEASKKLVTVFFFFKLEHFA